MAKSTKECSIEGKIETLQRHFGGIVSTVKDLKANLEALRKSFEQVQSSEVQEMVETQRVLEEIVVANSDSVKQIKSEILQLKRNECVEAYKQGTMEGQNVNQSEDYMKEIIEKQKMIDKTIVQNSDAIKVLDKEIICILDDKSKKDMEKKEVDNAIKELNKKIQKKQVNTQNVANDTVGDKVVNRKSKKCRYFNRGYCKYKTKCRYVHPKKICDQYLASQKCDNVDCQDRHPKLCKWKEGRDGCKRDTECDYLHVNLVNERKYQCVSCKDVWDDGSCMVEHIIQNTGTFFCLNCDEWVRNKSKVLEEGWTLLDGFGQLRMDI